MNIFVVETEFWIIKERWRNRGEFTINHPINGILLQIEKLLKKIVEDNIF